MEVLKYINENYLILVPALYILGSFLKNSPSVKDWMIPWILLVLSLVLSLLLGGFTSEAVIQGVLIAGTTVLTNQLYKQTKSEFKGE